MMNKMNRKRKIGDDNWEDSQKKKLIKAEAVEPSNKNDDSEKLPVSKQRKLIVKTVKDSNTVIIMGETGSGKTTQISQYLFKANINDHKSIAITQPRRVAAIELAKRVSEELKTNLGEKVGYIIRFDNMTTDNTKLIYMTDGILLRKALLDPLLMEFKIIILDEAHERSLETDVLFGIVKEAQRKRLKMAGNFHLKVVIMSATMDSKKFSEYFGVTKVVEVPGRQHPIEIIHNKKNRKKDFSYLDAAIETVISIHKDFANNQNTGNKDILVFLTGQEEIEDAMNLMKNKMMWEGMPPLVLYPFYSALPKSAQEKVFKPAPQGERKIIFSTNLAETSLTIPGIKYVIDTGVTKTRTFDPRVGLDRLAVQPISQAQAHQRSGRSGREGPGVCYRLYSEEEFGKLLKESIPEILRRSMASIIMRLLYMGIKNIETFDFMDKPSPELIKEGVQTLKWLGAIDNETANSELKLTEDGMKMAAFPLDPQFGRIILAANENGCLPHIIKIISMLSTDNIIDYSSAERKIVKDAQEEFKDTGDDIMALLRMFKRFSKASNKQEWCKKSYINFKAMKVAEQTREQLISLCESLGMKVEQKGGYNTDAIKKCLCKGLFMNVGRQLVQDKYVSNKGKEIFIHPNSFLYRNSGGPSVVIYCELVETSKIYMRNLCCVDMDWIKEALPQDYKLSSEKGMTDKEKKKYKKEKSNEIVNNSMKKKNC